MMVKTLCIKNKFSTKSLPEDHTCRSSNLSTKFHLPFFSIRQKVESPVDLFSPPCVGLFCRSTKIKVFRTDSINRHAEFLTGTTSAAPDAKMERGPKNKNKPGRSQSEPRGGVINGNGYIVMRPSFFSMTSGVIVIVI